LDAYMRVRIMDEHWFSPSMQYLTGMQEPDAALVLEKTGHGPRGYKMTMFGTCERFTGRV